MSLPFLQQPQPIIILGSHRSGTTMVTRLLEKLGLFVGTLKDENEEALFFIELNSWLLRQAGADWTNPAPFRYFLEHGLSRKLSVDYLRAVLSGPRAARFVGWKRFLKKGGVLDLDFPWGWKTPPSTFTLPVWLEIFSGAKIVHIYRHGIDVAASHKAFPDRMNVPEAIEEDYRRKKLLYLLMGKKQGFAGNLRCSSFEGSFSLWEEYMEQARGHVAALGTERAMEIRYEDFLAEPLEFMRQLVPFCGLTADEIALKRACDKINPARAFAYKKDEALSGLAEEYGPRLAAYGY